MSEAFVPLLDEADGRVVNIASASGPMFVNGCGLSARSGGGSPG